MTRPIVLSLCLLTPAGISFGGTGSGATGGKSNTRAQTPVQSPRQVRQENKEENFVLRKMLKIMNHANSRLDSDLQGIADSMLCESSKAIS